LATEKTFWSLGERYYLAGMLKRNWGRIALGRAIVMNASTYDGDFGGGCWAMPLFTGSDMAKEAYQVCVHYRILGIHFPIRPNARGTLSVFSYWLASAAHSALTASLAKGKSFRLVANSAAGSICVLEALVSCICLTWLVSI
jgi:hypothetical protein